MKKGIDVSHWQGDIDFQKVKNSGIDFVIIKAGGSDKGFYKDNKFEENYKNAKAAGLNVGCYYFVGKNFLSIEDGRDDALRFYEIIKDKCFEYPICLDIETTSKDKKQEATNAAISFCKTLESFYYYVSIYASDISGFKERLDLSRLMKFDLWVARYGKEPTYVKDFGIWQYSSTGSVDGIHGNVDMDLSYINYPSIMNRHHLNGF